MAIKLSIETGVTGSGATKWYALFKQRSTGKMADTTNNTWDTIVAGDLADYSLFLSEVSTSGVYEATVPAFVETASLTEPIDYVILATAAGTEAWTDAAIGKPRYEGTLTENANMVGASGSSTAADNLELAFTGATYNAAGLTVKTATDVETDTQDIQDRLPAALTADGNIKADSLRISGSATAADNVETCFTGTITTLDALDAAQDTQHSTTQNSLTTVLARLGSWTGTGVNTLLGAFKALLSKTASNPSDIGGTFDAATDSTEAIRDRGDAAWITGTGTSTLTQADIRTAVGLASANLDTQLADIPTVAEFNARTLPTADYFDAGSDTVTVGAFNTSAKAELQQEATDALNAYDPPTRAEATSDANSILAYVDLIDDGTSGLAKIATDVAAILVDTGTTLDAFIQAVKAKTDNLPSSPAAVGSAMTLTSGERNSVADAVLNRGASNIENSADRHSLGAVVMIATNASVASTTLTAKKPSDDTTFQTYTVTVDASADPITGVS